jgi:2,4-dienoyl-CoA reductase-like NADH-dependent reductase (Old Yellow Enzyme family)
LLWPDQSPDVGGYHSLFPSLERFWTRAWAPEVPVADPAPLNAFLSRMTDGAETADALVVTGQAEAVLFGCPFIANPDLATRFKTGVALARADRRTFYGGGETGYTDYSVASDF